MSKTNTALATTSKAGARALSALPIPVVVRPNLPPARRREQEADKLRIIEFAERLDKIGWGAVGTIEGMNETVPCSLLYPNPLCALDYDEDEVIALAEEMRNRINRGLRAQIEPILAMPAEDPTSEREGGTGAKFLILNGFKRWKALGYIGVPAWVVFTDEYATFYEASVAAVATKTTQHETTVDDFGRMIVGLMVIHEKAIERGIEVEPWPTQAQWAERLGRSQPTVSRWLVLAEKLHPVVRNMIVEGTMSESAAVEMRALSPAAQQVTARQLEDERRATDATTIPRTRVRDVVRSRRQGPIQWVNTAPPVPREELLLPILAQYDPPTAFGIVAHDMIKLLTASMRALKEQPPELVALQKALLAPRISQWVTRTRDELSQDSQ